MRYINSLLTLTLTLYLGRGIYVQPSFCLKFYGILYTCCWLIDRHVIKWWNMWRVSLVSFVMGSMGRMLTWFWRNLEFVFIVLSMTICCSFSSTPLVRDLVTLLLYRCVIHLFLLNIVRCCQFAEYQYYSVFSVQINLFSNIKNSTVWHTRVKTDLKKLKCCMSTKADRIYRTDRQTDRRTRYCGITAFCIIKITFHNNEILILLIPLIFTF